jgi:ankyrin repeat protein
MRTWQAMAILILGLFRKKRPPASLLELAFQGDLKAVRKRLSQDGRTEERGPQGATALMLACQEGHTAVARELLAAGANGNARNALGVTPMGLAAFGGPEETLDSFSMRARTSTRRIGSPRPRSRSPARTAGFRPRGFSSIAARARLGRCGRTHRSLSR